MSATVPRLWGPPRLPRGTAEQVRERLHPRPLPYASRPVEWVRERLGEYPWSKQQEVLNSVRDHRYTAVPSAHQTGKSFIAARIAAWWIDQHRPGEAFVVTTAPTAAQVSGVLWRELRKTHIKGRLKGKVLDGANPEWKLDGQELVAIGRSPRKSASPEEGMQAIQGYHARYMLVIIDEACGVPRWLYDGLESLTGNEHSRVLAIGNPDNPTAQFNEICKPGSGWNVIQISALDTPNFTGEWVPEELKENLVGKTWVKERIKMWGKKSPTFISKVLGRFPKVAEDTLISPDLIQQAQLRDLSDKALETAGRYGVDVADTGQDETVIYLNRNGYIRVARTSTGHECVWHGQDTMKTAGKVVRLLRGDARQTSAIVDGIGVGAGVVARLLEMSYPVLNFRASNRAYRHDKYNNRRSEQWWAVRELFEAGLIDIDPDDDVLASQLGSLKWWVDSAGRTHVEPKERMKRRLGGGSPDRADAFMMSTVPWDHLLPIEERGTRFEDAINQPNEDYIDVSDVAEVMDHDW